MAVSVRRSLEVSAPPKVAAACSYVNSEIDRLRNQTIGIAFICCAAAVFLSSLTEFGDARIALVLGAGISVFAFVRAQEQLTSSTKSIFAKRIIAGLGQELTYHPNSSFTLKHFLAMDLFTEHCQRLESSDEVSGQMFGVKYSLHRVHANASRRAPFFEGVIMKLDFKESFPAHTIIVPDDHGMPTAPLGAGPKKDLVMMKNPAFEQVFSVYSTDYYEARKLVTPFFMQLVTEAQARLGSDLRLCFLQRSLYLAVPGDALQFRPTLFGGPLTPRAAVGMLAFLIPLAQRLAEVHGS